MSHHRIELLLEQMDYTHGWVVAPDRALDGLTAQQAAWTPGDGVNSIWQTVRHLTFWKELCRRRLCGALLSDERIDNTATFGAADTSADDATAWQAAVDSLRTAHHALREAVASCNDGALDQPLPGEQTPLRELLEGLNLHDAYHLGQIIVLRKLQGSWAGQS